MMKIALLKMKNGMTKAYVKVKGYVDNQDGVSTIEWVGLAAVIVALMFAVATAMNGQGSGLASAIVTKISNMISQIGN